VSCAARSCCFNSLMVRLKANACCISLLATTGFNSLMVRLKVIQRVIYNLAKPGFNSLMVRLKDRSIIVIKESLFLFQFLDGAIKRLGQTTEVSTTARFNSLMVRLKVGC